MVYPRALKAGVEVQTALNGYVDRDTYSMTSGFCKPFAERGIDVGVRVTKLPPTYGKLGTRKWELAEKFSLLAEERGLRTDVSSKPEDVLLGQEWYKFLGNCKFTVARKAGASICDPYSRMATNFSELDENNWGTNFDADLKKNSRRWDLRWGNFSSVSPRILEAAGMKVCQILEVDDYSILQLQPWEHYIPLRSDFQNIDEIFSFMQDSGRVQRMTESAYDHLVASGKFTYSHVFNEIFPLPSQLAIFLLETSIFDASEFFLSLNCTCGSAENGSVRALASRLFREEARWSTEWFRACSSCRLALRNWKRSAREGGVVSNSYDFPWTSV
jgi:hypothetical protein